MNNNLWELVDEFEARSKDHHHCGPIARYVWKQAFEELRSRLGERVLP
jgi:hypothetical protein